MRNEEYGTNNAAVRVENLRRVTKLLYRHGALTRQNIAETLKISLPTVNNLIHILSDEGLIYFQNSAMPSTGGRIPALVSFRYDKALSVGIAILDTEYRIVMIDLQGNVVALESFDLDFDVKEEYWNEINDRLCEMLDEHQIPRERILGVGIAVPGPVFRHTGSFDSWLLNLKEFSFQKLESIFGFPIFVENDANAAGFAEIWMRPDLQDAVLLFVSRDLGGSIIRDRKIVHGDNSLTGEFGHMIIVPNGRRCLCGRKGCLDRYCSLAIIQEHCPKGVAAFFEEKDTDPELNAYWKQYVEYLCIALTNITNAMDKPLIIGGELSEYLAPCFDEIKECFGRMDSFRRDVSSMCKLSKFGRNSAAIGVALFPVNEYLHIE